MTRRLLGILALAGVCGAGAACETLYSRDVTAVISGPTTVAVGATVLLTVRLEYSDGAFVDLGPSHIGTVVWQSSNTAVATIDQAGVVTGVSKGSVTITATPHPTTTGSGKRTADTHDMTVQ